MSSSDCTSCSGSPQSSPLHKSGGATTPPPTAILGQLLTDDDNDTMSDEYSTSDDPADGIACPLTNSNEAIQSKEQNLRTSEQTTNNVLPDSSDASTSESASLANKEDESPVAGASLAQGGAAVAAKKGLRRVDPKSKKIKKSKLVSVRKSQLTPRMALYIPPHLQKQTQHVTAAPKATVASPSVALTPQQKQREKQMNEKLKLVAKAYQVKQYRRFSKILSKAAAHNGLPQSVKTRNARKSLPAKLWTTEMQTLLLNRNTCHEKFVELGEEDKRKESKHAKMKLRKLLRKARSKPSTPKNPYKILEKAHEEYEKSEAFKKFKGSKSYEERKFRSSNDSGGSTSFEMTCDVDDHLEPEYDSSFFLSLSQRHEARMEWSEAILEFNSSPANRFKSPPEIVKVEVIDSDEDSVQNESPSRSKISSATEKNPKRYGKFDSNERALNASTSRSSKQSSTSSTTQGSMDVSNNEYLNQQFLRRQHDYEREQKYQQIELASESNAFLLGSTENLFRGRDTMEDPLRLQPPVSPFPPMFGNAVNPNSVRFPPVFPIRNIFNAGRPLPEREPEEPFVGDRRRRLPHPALVAPILLGSGEPPNAKELQLVDMPNRSQAKGRRARSFSPGPGHRVGEVNGSHTSDIGRNVTLFRSSRENSPLLRNYSNDRINNREYPPSRPLSPFSERIVRAAEKDNKRTSHDERVRGRENSRQLSPFSERMRNRESSSKRLSPFSERMRSRENIDRHFSPARESNIRPEIGRYPLRKSAPHRGDHELNSDRPRDDRVKLVPRHVRSSDKFPNDGTVGKRDGVNLRESVKDWHETKRNSFRRGREFTAHEPQCPRFALQSNQTAASKDSSGRRRESERGVHGVANSRTTHDKFAKRSYEAGDPVNSRKQSEIRRRTRNESSPGPYQSPGKRPRR